MLRVCLEYAWGCGVKNDFLISLISLLSFEKEAVSRQPLFRGAQQGIGRKRCAPGGVLVTGYWLFFYNVLNVGVVVGGDADEVVSLLPCGSVEAVMLLATGGGQETTISRDYFDAAVVLSYVDI